MTYRIALIVGIITIFGCAPQETNVVKRAPLKDYHSTWSHYLGDPESTQFSALDQVNTTNVKNLKVAWSYKSGGLSEGRTTQIQANPIIIEGTLFSVSASSKLFAIDAKTGEEKWTFESPVKDNSGLGISRGVMSWVSDLSDEPSRILFSSGPRLFAINLSDGSLIDSFGKNGSIDLREKLGRDPKKLTVVLTTPGVVHKNLMIIGLRTSETPGAAPGYIRAYDVISGEMKWVFKTIPEEGEFGYDTWSQGPLASIGGANSWAGLALDQENEIVYAPTGSAAFDWYGGNRLGDNLFANCLIALNANTGERIWHYQIVKHDLWDRDLPATPNLFEIEREGELIPAVAQITKTGHVFVFNRLTGEPLFPIEEKEYPGTKLEGDHAAKTQPLPTKPEPFAKQRLDEKDLYAPNQPAFVDDFIDKKINEKPITVLEKFRETTSDGQFVPIDTKGVILYPGADGGGEWGGAAIDPRKGIMYVNGNEMAWIVRMSKVGMKDGKVLSKGASLAQVHCTRCHGGNLQGLGAIPELNNIKERLSINEIKDAIVNGRGAMPGMPNLEEHEVTSLASFLAGVEKVEKEDDKAGDHRAETSSETPYAIAGFGRFKDDRGFPVVKPPWGTLSAIDLNSGEYLWKRPLGHDKALNDPKYPETGTENYGGPVITSGDLIFIAATRDEMFRAFAAESGELLFEYQLPAGGYATPAVYEIDGKQYVVIACGGGKMGTKSGDQYIAFSLPE